MTNTKEGLAKNCACFIVVEYGERGFIDVNGVGVQQVHEVGSCIVRTTAIVNDKQVTSYRQSKRKFP